MTNIAELRIQISALRAETIKIQRQGWWFPIVMAATLYLIAYGVVRLV